ncbi:unnamed protein product [Rodentolepis nana]|uniref:Hexosyltransferase n=1 Tax=Rodentolepis nana TaxID=102285 RepID=A0A0R3TSY6_RODNA|nr:unnamed protein product [Rodentolepis nana]
MKRITFLLIGLFGVLFLWAWSRIYSVKRYDILEDTVSRDRRVVQKWPFDIKKVNGVYELHLNYQTESKNYSEYSVLDQYVLQDGAKNRLLKFRDLIDIPDKLWKLPIDPRVTLVYPQAINISDAIYRLIDGKPLNEKPINIPKFRYLSISSQVCNPENPSSQELNLIIVVKSGIANFNKRREFRHLYSYLTHSFTYKLYGIRIGLVFSLGIPRQQKDNTFLRGNRVIRLDVSGGEFLNPEGLKEVAKNLKQEMETHWDVILGDYEDTYFNLSLKTQYSFTWAATFCRKSRPIFVFLDDDIPFCERCLLRSLLDLSPMERQVLFHGIPIHGNKVCRFEIKEHEKWCSVKSEVPWPEHVPFLLGCFQLISFDSIEKIALGMLFTQKFINEDAWLGIIASRLGIRPKSVGKIMRKYKIPTRKPNYFKSIHKKCFNFH